jgi:hypothetical protein
MVAPLSLSDLPQSAQPASDHGMPPLPFSFLNSTGGSPVPPGPSPQHQVASPLSPHLHQVGGMKSNALSARGPIHDNQVGIPHNVDDDADSLAVNLSHIIADFETLHDRIA